MVFIAWFLLGSLILVLILLALYLIIGHCLYKKVFYRNSIFKKKLEKKENTNFEKEFWDKHQFIDANIISFDGIKLYAKYLGAGSQKVALLVHGYGGNFCDMAKYAQLFLNKGFDLLVVDNRAHGKSEGEIVGMSWLDKQDIKCWCEFLTNINSNYRILLFGQSMGASAVCNFAGDKFKNIVGAIEDCGFDNAEKQLKYIFGKVKIKFNLLFKIFLSYSNRKNDYKLKEVDCIKQLKKTNVPVLVIHGNADNFVPTEMGYNIFNSLSEFRREIYIAKDAGHTKSFEVDERKYKNAIYDFLSKHNI